MSDLVKQVNTWVVEPGKRGYLRLKDQCEAMGREFSLWADNSLPEPWANVAKKIFTSIPIAAAIFICPLAMNIVLGVGFYVVDLAYGPFSDEFYDLLARSATLGCAASTLYHFTMLVVTLDPWCAVQTAIHALATGIFFKRSSFAQI
jgi:hypothetical protein